MNNVSNHSPQRDVSFGSHFIIFHAKFVPGTKHLQSLRWIWISIWLLFASQVKLHFTKDALRLIARKAMGKNTGARGLRSLLENILMEAMYEVWILFGSLDPCAHANSPCSTKPPSMFIVRTSYPVLVSLCLDLYLLNLSFPLDSCWSVWMPFVPWVFHQQVLRSFRVHLASFWECFVLGMFRSENEEKLIRQAFSLQFCTSRKFSPSVSLLSLVSFSLDFPTKCLQFLHIFSPF